MILSPEWNRSHWYLCDILYYKILQPAHIQAPVSIRNFRELPSLAKQGKILARWDNPFPAAELQINTPLHLFLSVFVLEVGSTISVYAADKPIELNGSISILSVWFLFLFPSSWSISRTWTQRNWTGNCLFLNFEKYWYYERQSSTKSQGLTVKLTKNHHRWNNTDSLQF